MYNTYKHIHTIDKGTNIYCCPVLFDLYKISLIESSILNISFLQFELFYESLSGQVDSKKILQSLLLFAVI